MNWGFQSDAQRDKYQVYRDMDYEYQHTEPTGEIVMAKIQREPGFTQELHRIMIGNDGSILIS